MRNVSNIILQPKERCILRLPEVEKRTGYKRSHMYNLKRVGKFPKAIKTGIRSVGWDSYAIEEWINEHLDRYRTMQEELQEEDLGKVIKKASLKGVTQG